MKPTLHFYVESESITSIESMTSEELGMHIFIENTDQVLGKLAIDELQKKVPSMESRTQWNRQKYLLGMNSSQEKDTVR